MTTAMPYVHGLVCFLWSGHAAQTVQTVARLVLGDLLETQIFSSECSVGAAESHFRKQQHTLRVRDTHW